MPESFHFDLFISYSHRDNSDGYISKLVARIQKEYRDFTGGKQLHAFFEKDEIGSRVDRQRSSLDGICSSHLLLICLSPNYLESEYCSWEFNEYLRHKAALAPGANGVPPVYFVEIPGQNDKGFEQRAAEWVTELRRRQNFDFRPWFDEGAEALKETAVRTLLKSAEDQTGDGLSDIRRAIRAKGTVDRHNDNFMGRCIELCRLREIVAFGKPGMITVINGQDGIGKTALATEYSHAFAHEYPGGCWQVPCRDREDLRVALANMAGARDLEFEFTEEEKRDLDLGLARLLSELKLRADSAEPSRVLLLLDNVDRPKLLQARQIRQLPRADWLHVIATTRFLEHELFSRRKDVTCMTLNALPQGDALALIERFQPGGTFPDDVTREAAHDIVRLLGGFTLAVERAAISVGHLARDLDCVAFRDRLRSVGLSEFEQDDDERTIDGLCHSEACLSATLRPTLEQLGEPERMASIFAALLPADHIALPWVRELTAQAFPDLGEHGSDRLSDPWQDLSQRLFDLRLLQPGVHWHEARMHRLIQKIVRLHAGAETVALREQELLEHVKSRAEFLWEGWVRKENRWELVPLVALAWHWLHRGASLGVYLANQAFGSLRNLGCFAETEPLIRRALAVEEGSFGLNHPNVATCLNNLAALLHETSRLKEAEPIYRRALAIYERSFAPNDPRVATCLNNLAQLLQATNRADQAEALYRRVLAIDEQGFGPNDPKVATHLNNLAQLLQATNRLEEAEALYRRALAVDEHGLGPNHPKVASHLSNLARLLHTTNRLDEAKSLYRRALAIDEQSFGPHHSRVATHLNNLALLLKSTDRLEEAEALYRRALAIDEQNFGPDHPNVGSDLNNLAALLEATNRLDEAEQLMRLMLGIFFRSSASTGREDPFLRTGVRNYAALLADMGRSPSQIIARLSDLARPFGIKFDSAILSEIARQSQKRRTAPWSSVLSGYFSTFTSLFRKAVALLAWKNRVP